MPAPADFNARGVESYRSTAAESGSGVDAFKVLGGGLQMAKSYKFSDLKQASKQGAPPSAINISDLTIRSNPPMADPADAF